MLLLGIGHMHAMEETQQAFDFNQPLEAYHGGECEYRGFVQDSMQKDVVFPALASLESHCSDAQKVSATVYEPGNNTQDIEPRPKKVKRAASKPRQPRTKRQSLQLEQQDKIGQCDICQQFIVNTPFGITQHNFMCHVDQQDFDVCYLCGRGFAHTRSSMDNPSLDHHIKTHQDVLQCLDCRWAFGIHSRDLLYHKIEHIRAKKPIISAAMLQGIINKLRTDTIKAQPRTLERAARKEFFVEGCCINFDTDMDRLQHNLLLHAKDFSTYFPTYRSCSQCGRGFLVEQSLENHEKLPHETLIKCPEVDCESKFRYLRGTDCLSHIKAHAHKKLLEDRKKRAAQAQAAAAE